MKRNVWAGFSVSIRWNYASSESRIKIYCGEVGGTADGNTADSDLATGDV